MTHTTNPRKGLKRDGMRAYICGNYRIIRDRPWRFLVRSVNVEPLVMDFMAIKFKRLRFARTWCETH
jgi:hypothetical protein